MRRFFRNRDAPPPLRPGSPLVGPATGPSDDELRYQVLAKEIGRAVDELRDRKGEE